MANYLLQISIRKNYIPEQAPAALLEERKDEEEVEIVAKRTRCDIMIPYDEADPNNRPPPASNDESEFAPSVIPVFDAENRPVPPIIHFSSTYEMGESSSTREILKDIGEVYPLGPVPLLSRVPAIRRIRKFNEQMALDGAVRECQADVSKAGVREQYVPKFLLRGGFVETSTRSFLGPFTDNPYLQARNAAMAD
ncbi:hypothetical protein Tco_0531706 [Tanacetum coccineum]